MNSTASSSSSAADRKCSICDDGKLYNMIGLKYHMAKEHRERVVVTVDNNQLCFKRRTEDGLFPCVCGELLSHHALRHHALECSACIKASSAAQGGKPIDIEPAVESRTAKQYPKGTLRKCDECSDNKLYTERRYSRHKRNEHQKLIFSRVRGISLRFRRRPEDKLFLCACGSTLKGVDVDSHCKNCDSCRNIVAQAKGGGPVDVLAFATTNNHKSHTGATSIKCNLCNDGVLYSVIGLDTHKQQVHKNKVIVTVGNKRLRFTRRFGDDLFPCACGELFPKYSNLRFHVPSCAVCNDVAAKAQGKESVDVATVDKAAQVTTLSNGLAASEPTSAPSTSRGKNRPATRIGATNRMDSAVRAPTSLSRTGKTSDTVLFEPEILRLADLAIHRELKMILCKRCKAIVPPQQARDHLQNGCHELMVAPESKLLLDVTVGYVNSQKELLTAVQIKDWMERTIERQKHGPAIPQVPILPLLENGFKCSNCGLAWANAAAAKDHITNELCHSANAKVLTKISLQQLTKDELFSKYIHVDTGQTQMRGDRSALDIMAGIMWSAAQTHRERKAREAGNPTLDHGSSRGVASAQTKLIKNR